MGIVKRLGAVVLLLLGALTLSWVLPFFYHLAFDREYDVPFSVYSGVTGTFAILGGAEHRYADDAGRVYTRAQFDSILPGLYYSQLAVDGRFPDTLHGQPITVEEMERSFFVFHCKPQEVNRVSIPLYPLLDGDARRVAFAEPTEVCRWGQAGIELLSIDENRVLREKSQRFRQALAGLVLPVQLTVGDPNVRKEYDNGYLIVDGANALFQLKEAGGEPVVRRLMGPPEGQIAQVWVTEFEDRLSLGYVATTLGGFYRIDARTGACVELPIGGFDPRTMSLVLLGNKFDQTVKIIQERAVRYVALSGGAGAPRVLRTRQLDVPEMASARVGRFLVPFELHFSDGDSAQVYPRVLWSGVSSLVLGALLALATMVVFRRFSCGRRIVSALGVLFLGVYLLIPLLLWRD